jgi:AcrR family transcriptional regulator
MLSVPEPRPVERLSRDRIVDAALAIADRDGLEGLSMRRLASELGTGAMSLYNYVPDKKALLDALVERVVGTVDLPVGVAPRQICQIWAHSVRTTICRHRAVIPVMMTTDRSILRSLAVVLFGALRDAGVGAGDAQAVVEVLARFEAGSVMLDADAAQRHESRRRRQDATFDLGVTALLDGLALQLTPDRNPNGSRQPE